uniref:Ig-like domain-containing protein n=1 Tax=Amphilophus citrinellus TaxID=61819 RepID=A0A3Q0S9E3_AMPCI
TPMLHSWFGVLGLQLSIFLRQKIITADPGQDVTLTCRAPDNNIVGKWDRADLGDEHVLLYRDEQFVPDNQHPSFKNRVDLQDRQMKDGDVSLILKNVTTADSGTYQCRVVQRDGGSFTERKSVETDLSQIQMTHGILSSLLKFCLMCKSENPIFQQFGV